MRPRRSYGPNPPGRLPAAMLRALAAELSDPGRFARAKSYARDGAVVDIEVDPGEARATIQGSRFEPYVATVFVAPSDDDDSLLGLIPDRDEVMASCTCPDDGPYGGAFCKHALATLLTLADEVTIEPDVLARWRSGDVLALDAPDVERDAPALDVLADALSAAAPIPAPPQLPARLPVTMAGPHGEDVGRVLADALAVLRSH
jgi:uncharacterized Zn finger protein